MLQIFFTSVVEFVGFMSRTFGHLGAIYQASISAYSAGCYHRDH